MTDQPTPPPPQPDRFKADMPAIPGVASGSKRGSAVMPLALIGGLAVIAIAVFFVGRWLFKPHVAEAPPQEPAPQLEVPAPPPDPAAALPHSTAANPEIGKTAQFAKPWSSQEFIFRDRLNGENIPAILVRLPSGSANSAAGYWALSLKAPYGSCKLEYVDDLNKLKTDYDFHGARHPMIGNPCSRTLFDPLSWATLPGSILVRGKIVQGSDLRPPLSIELQMQKGNILALRIE